MRMTQSSRLVHNQQLWLYSKSSCLVRSCGEGHDKARSPCIHELGTSSPSTSHTAIRTTGWSSPAAGLPMTLTPASPSTDIQPPAGYRLFIGFFVDALEVGLPLVPLRPKSRDLETALSGGDYDLLMPPDGYPRLLAVLC